MSIDIVIFWLLLLVHRLLGSCLPIDGRDLSLISNAKMMAPFVVQSGCPHFSPFVVRSLMIRWFDDTSLDFLRHKMMDEFIQFPLFRESWTSVWSVPAMCPHWAVLGVTTGHVRRLEPGTRAEMTKNTRSCFSFFNSVGYCTFLFDQKEFFWLIFNIFETGSLEVDWSGHVKITYKSLRIKWAHPCFQKEKNKDKG